MDVKLTRKELITVEIGPLVVEDMEAVSRWEGLLKLKGKDGSVVIVSDPFPPGFVSRQELNSYLVSGSPDILDTITQVVGRYRA